MWPMGPASLIPTVEEALSVAKLSNGGDAVVTFNGGEAEGDVVVVWTSHSTVNPSSMPAPSTAGYLECGSVGGNLGAEMFVKVLGASPDSEVRFADDANQMAINVWRLRGADPTKPLDIVSPDVQAFVTTKATPAVDVERDESLVLSMVTTENASPGSVTYPAGYTEGQLLQVAGTSSQAVAAGAGKEIPTAGTETPGAFDFSIGTAWHQAATVVVNPVLSDGIAVDSGSFSIDAQSGNTVLSISGAAENDIIVVQIAKEDTIGAISQPQEAGYVALAASTGAALRSRVFLKRVTSTPDTTITIAGDAIAGDTHDYAGSYHVLRGIDPAADLSLIAENLQSNNVATTATPTAVSVGLGDIVFVSVALDGLNNQYISGMSGYKDYVQAVTSGAAGSGITFSSAVKSITSSGTETPGSFQWGSSDFQQVRTLVFPSATMPDVSADFGELTRQGAGGVAVTGTSITSGDPSGHWQISGGEVSPSATGEDTISGIYNLTLDDASTVELTVVSNKASVASAAELTAAWSALPASTATGILIRDGDYSGEARQTLTSKAFTNEVVVEPHTTFVAAADPKQNTHTVTLPGIVLAADTSNTRWRGLKFYETLAGASLETNGVFEITSGGTTTANITIEDCEIASFDFRTAYDNGVFADASNFVGVYATQGLFFANLDAIRGIKAIDVNNFRALRNHIHDVTRGMVMSDLGIDGGNRSRIAGNWIEDVISNFTTAGGQTDGLDIWDNLAINCWGSDGEVPSNPLHSAVGLSFDNPSTGAFQNVSVMGNLMHVGWGRQKYTVDSGDTYTVTNAATGMKFNDPQNTYAYQNITVAHNLIVSHGLCLEFSGAQNIDVYNNTLSYEDYEGGTIPSYYFQGAENLRMWNNIGPVFAIGSNDGGTENGSPMVTTTDTSKQYGNLSAGGTNGDLGFASVFQGITGSFDFLTHDQLAAAYTPVSTSYALTATEKKGALGTGYYSAGGNDTAPSFADPTATSTNYTPVTTSWPGTAYLLRGGGLTGAADGREVTIAWQGELDAAQDGNQFYSITSNSFSISARHLGGDDIRFTLENPSGTVILQADMTRQPELNSALGQHAWAFSADLTTGQVTMALNGKPLPIPLSVGGASGVSLEDIDWTTSNWAINATTSGTNIYTGNFDAALISDTFIDLDTTAGLNKLFASDGLFKDWGAAGVNINGGSELVVIQGANAAALNGGTANSGTGGAFTMTGTVTDAGADTTAPVLTLPTATENGSDGATNLGVTTDEGNGTLYWGIYPTASTPSSADVVAGTGATVNGSQAVSATGVQAVSDQTGLTASTAYKAHYVHDDAATNRSNLATSAEFTTTAGGGGGFAVDEGASGGTFRTSGGNRIWEADSTADLVVTTGGTVSAILVGGGGAGGSREGGGGGAGEYLYRNADLVLTAATHTATVGAGAPTNTTSTAAGANGSDTTFFGITVEGGNGGGGINAGPNATASGSGGGHGEGSLNGVGQTASTSGSGLANDGGDSPVNQGGGGGGGSAAVGATGTAGTNGGNGGAGTSSPVPGDNIAAYAGGGGGWGTNSQGTGAAGGGNSNAATHGDPATANTGSGGGGGSATFGQRDGGAGGSGRVVVWWPI